MNEDLARALVTILFGALAGGLTNSIAIWMLFHPYEPPRLLGRSMRLLQGAIPKNKARLASSIGRTVGTRLLTPADLARAIQEPGFRAAFDERLTLFLQALLERRWGSLAELLPPSLSDELRRILDETATGVARRLDDYLASEEFHEAAVRWVERLAEEFGNQPLGEVLTPEREAALAETARSWIGDAVAGEGFENAVADYLRRTTEQYLVPGRTFEDVLPIGLVAGLERAIAGYLPVALERLGGLLEDPQARERLERVLHDLLQRFLRDLRFHQRVMAALLMPPDMVERVLTAIEVEGTEQLSSVLHDPAVRDAMARKVNDAIVEFLRRPVTEVLGSPGDPSVEEAQATIGRWVLNLARDDQTHAFLIEKLRATLTAAEHRTWDDLFRRVPPEQIASMLVASVRTERAAAFYTDVIRRVTERALERPIGRPADFLPEDSAGRLERAIAEPLWAWIQEQVPGLAQRLDVAGRVEQKILAFPTPQVEELIRSVTQRELRLIIWFGYLLGGIVGLVLVLVNSLFA